MRVGLTRSNHPVYDNISCDIANDLRLRPQFKVYEIPDSLQHQELCLALKENKLDVIISTNELSPINRLINEDSPEIKTTSTKLIHLHYDNILTSFSNPRDVAKKIEFFRTREHDHHFVIESNNVGLLENLGIRNAFTFNHATSLKPQIARPNAIGPIRFIGTIISSNDILPPEYPPFRKELSEIYRERINSREKEISQLEAFAHELCENSTISDPLGKTCVLRILLYYYNSLTLGYRGEVINSINNIEIQVHGARDGNFGINKRVFEANYDRSFFQKTCIQPGINLNLSSLQLFEACNNRLLDLLALKTPVLTDYSAQALQISPNIEYFTFKSLEELRSKYISIVSMNARELDDLLETICEDIDHSARYEIVLDRILDISL
jgi:hypothetical protein